MASLHKLDDIFPELDEGNDRQWMEGINKLVNTCHSLIIFFVCFYFSFYILFYRSFFLSFSFYFYFGPYCEGNNCDE